jgi:CubicO group peptidase (beta-lactamase class C family)
MFQRVKGSAIAVVVASLWLASCGGGGGDGPAPLPIPPAPSAGVVGDGRLAELADWARSTQDAPAIAVVLVRSGQVAESAAVGKRSADGSVAVTTADRWHMGSLTKAMTGTLASVLVENGVIDWDTTPQEVWPESAAEIHADFQNITLRHLLSHTSGMKRDDQFDAAQNDAPGTLTEKRRQWAARLLGEAAQFSADEVHYSNVGYTVAAAMLEARGGTSWETLLTDRVFAPLGMTDSGFGAPGTAGQIDQPRGHRSRANGFSPVEPGSPGSNIPAAAGPAGSVHTTLGDYAQFMLTNIDGARDAPNRLGIESLRVLHEAPAGGYSLGWGAVSSLPTLNTPGFENTGSIGLWFSRVWLAPTLNTGVMIAVNGGGDRGLAALEQMDLLMRQRVAASQ